MDHIAVEGVRAHISLLVSCFCRGITLIAPREALTQGDGFSTPIEYADPWRQDVIDRAGFHWVQRAVRALQARLSLRDAPSMNRTICAVSSFLLCGQAIPEHHEDLAVASDVGARESVLAIPSVAISFYGFRSVASGQRQFKPPFCSAKDLIELCPRCGGFKIPFIQLSKHRRGDKELSSNVQRYPCSEAVCSLCQGGNQNKRRVGERSRISVKTHILAFPGPFQSASHRLRWPVMPITRGSGPWAPEPADLIALFKMLLQAFKDKRFDT